jgi:DNA-binding transcriptional LysR family regulator
MVLLGMDTQFLESFVIVVEQGAVAEAARRLNLTAAAVTQRLRALRDLRSLANEKSFSGELRLGAVASALTGLLPPLLANMAVKYPALTLRIDPGTSTELYAKVADGELDAAVIVAPRFALPKNCDWRTWREEKLIVLAHRHIEGDDAYAIVKDEPFIRYDRKQWGGRLADDYLQRAGIQPADRYELDSLDAIAVLVDRALGVSLVPDWAPPWPEVLSLRKIALPMAFESRRIGLLWRRDSARLRLVQALLSEAESK